MVARLGGDEFAVLLEDCTREQATLVAEKLRETAVAFVFGWQGLSFRIGLSIGVVPFADARRSPAELLRRADALCYRAKSTGRDRVVVDSG